MLALFDTLPELVADVESALLRIGQGRIAEQLREATVYAWTFDDFSQSTYLQLASSAPEVVAQTIPLDDDIGVCVDLDAGDRVVGLEVMGYEDILARLPRPAGA